MKHRLLALGLSALTLIGGHFYNRRWDRAVLLFLILMLWGIGVYASLMLSMSRLAVSGSTEAFSAILASHWAALGLGGLLLWVVSLIVTYWDAGRTGEPLAHWTGSAVIAAVGLSLLNGIFMLMLLITGSATTRFSDDVDPDRAEVSSGPVRHASTNFSHYVYLGGYPNLREELPKPPDGDGYLRGRFIYEGRPAAGVSFRLALNGKYETDRLTTDERGAFRLRLPRGEWSVNRLVTREWSDKPEEDRLQLHDRDG